MSKTTHSPFHNSQRPYFTHFIQINFITMFPLCIYYKTRYNKLLKIVASFIIFYAFNSAVKLSNWSTKCPT